MLSTPGGRRAYDTFQSSFEIAVMARRRFEDDDYDRPSRRRRSEPSNDGGNTAVKIVAIIGGIVLLFALICGGLVGYGIWSARKAADEASREFAKTADKQLDKMAEEQRLREKERESSDRAVSLRAAEAFSQELKGRRVDAAYALTTVEYQRRVTRAEFAELLDQHKDELNTGLPFREDIFAPEQGTSYIYKRNLFARGGGGFLELSITIVKVGNTWKVDQLSIEPDR
jgi:hypothetical protein